MSLHYTEFRPMLKRYEAIKCFTHNVFLANKAQCRFHKGCDVDYTDKDGNRQ
jgi:hypothetical protein